MDPENEPLRRLQSVAPLMSAWDTEAGTVLSAAELAKQILAGKLFADTTTLNKLGKALGYDQNRLYVIRDGKEWHIAEIVASENLKSASDMVIHKAIKAQQKTQSANELRRLDRMAKGRTRGAGAGGYNRDIGNIEHRIDDARIKIAVLHGELTRRQGHGSQ